MRRQNRERWHSINRQWLRDGRRERLRKERDTALRLAPAREELALEALVALRDEERGRAQAPAAVLPGVDLVVEQPLDVVDGEQMLAVHRNDDGVPDLRHENLAKTGQ